MGRLIDADALCKKIRKIYDGYMMDECGCCPLDFENMVDEQPTAYDVDKVVAELEELKEKSLSSYDYETLKIVTDIARKGGVE